VPCQLQELAHPVVQGAGGKTEDQPLMVALGKWGQEVGITRDFSMS